VIEFTIYMFQYHHLCRSLAPAQLCATVLALVATYLSILCPKNKH